MVLKMNLNIEETDICCPFCLSDAIVEKLSECDEYDGVSVYSYADVISELLKILLISEVDGKEFTFGMVDFDGQGCDYIGEYILTVSDDKSIWVEPAFRNIDGKQELFDSDSYITFVDKKCDSSILARLIGNGESVALFEFE
jgi:hypothetical protein